VSLVSQSSPAAMPCHAPRYKNNLNGPFYCKLKMVDTKVDNVPVQILNFSIEIDSGGTLSKSVFSVK
jgi:hypothetical protein